MAHRDCRKYPQSWGPRMLEAARVFERRAASDLVKAQCRADEGALDRAREQGLHSSVQRRGTFGRNTIPCPPRGCLIGCIMASTLRRHSVTDGTALSLALLPRIEPIETNRRRRPAGGARGAVAASSTMSLRVDLARSNRPS